ncbi:hypothetical protein SAMN05421636_108329 [Pricia antarctica]|uniref:Uncharacterized protein n=1 Tax=Pricia antarctica TaxID=641691 RepID=A0A1G7GX88_9FLAO|nr:hypothetical protein [Pricia antarctica]SDE92756.1 hypothetical protein SAMN05421636_108329 [Pricia antarctica]
MMRDIRAVFLRLSMAIAGLSIFAQVSVTGHVTDSGGTALIGAQVMSSPIFVYNYYRCLQ